MFVHIMTTDSYNVNVARRCGTAIIMPRKKPFSSKQKRKQLQEKRDKRKVNVGQELTERFRRTSSKELSTSSSDDVEPSKHQEGHTEDKKTSKINQQPVRKSSDKGFDPNRYHLHFEKESKTEISRRKEAAMLPLHTLSAKDLEIDMDDLYKPGSVLDIPKRPAWNHKMTRQDLELKEQRMFREYLDTIYQHHSSKHLSHFEHNLETWRQLWRVLEISDIVLLITDIRYPALHVSPALYHYIVDDLKKHVIVVLNKADMVSPGLAVAWKHYFTEKFPKISIVLFTSFPDSRWTESTNTQTINGNMKRSKKSLTPLGPRQLYTACQRLVGDRVDLTSWLERIETILNVDSSPNQPPVLPVTSHGHQPINDFSPDQDLPNIVSELFSGGILTIGCVGFPNVGKSSLMNSMVGRKVVSVSKTPGHTKHFQTYFLSHNVRVCDCPGLVLPSLVDKQLQVLSGMYPIAQVQEPYTSVGYLAERVCLVDILKLTHPDQEADTTVATADRHRVTVQWSAWAICDAWAEKRGFTTAKAARNDVYRAANSILRLAIDGRVCLCLTPPAYTHNTDYFESLPETKELVLCQKQALKPANHSQAVADSDGFTSDNESENEMSCNYSNKESDADTDSPKSFPLSNHNPFSVLADEEG